jgi:hypothetical protein
MSSIANFEFQCVGGGAGYDLCFNNGTCYVTTIGTQRCECVEDFTADLFFFHFDNCVGKKRALLTWLPFAIPFTVIFFVLLGMLLMLLPRLKNQERTLAYVTGAAWVCTEFFVVSSVFQEGCFESCAFFSSLAFMLDYLALHLAVVRIMETLQRGTRILVTSHADSGGVSSYHIRWFRVFTCLLMAGSFCSGVAMIVFTRDEDRRSYNIATLCNCITLWLAGMFFCSSIVVFTKALDARILEVINVSQQVFANSSSSNLAALNRTGPLQHQEFPSVAKLRPRLRSLRLGGYAVGIPFLCLVIPFPVAFYLLGSIPYYFIISILHFVCNVLVIVGIVGFLYKQNPSHQQKSQDTSSSANAKKDGVNNLHAHKQVVAAVPSADAEAPSVFS